jgi:hypothetical protein
MRNEPKKVCRMEGCGQHVPVQLAQERLCLEHFVEHTYVRAQHAVQSYQQDLPFRLDAVEWMFEDAKFSLMALLRDSNQPYREHLGELMICLANLHEYVRYHAGNAKRENDAPATEEQAAMVRAGRGAA